MSVTATQRTKKQITDSIVEAGTRLIEDASPLVADEYPDFESGLVVPAEAFEAFTESLQELRLKYE